MPTAPTLPTAIDTLPTPPTISDPASFDSRADATLVAQQAMVPQINAQNTLLYNNALATYNNAVAAAASQVAALASENAAAASSGATMWVSGTTYAIGNVRYSPTNWFAYRRTTAGAGTTDPSTDSANWASIANPAFPNEVSAPTFRSADTLANGAVTGIVTHQGDGVLRQSPAAQVKTFLNYAITDIIPFYVGYGASAVSSNLAVGVTFGSANSSSGGNIAVGKLAMASLTGGTVNVAVGCSALSVLTTGYDNVAVGNQASGSLTAGTDTTSVGYQALLYNTASGNTAVGSTAMMHNTSGIQNVALGYSALSVNTTGYSNTAAGWLALSVNTTGYSNTAAGEAALGGNTTGAYNTAIGQSSLPYNNGDYNTALGAVALTSTGLSNSTGVGYSAEVTGSNQVQLGNSSTTTYVYGTVQNRSDLRDKADVRDTVLGLDFINAVRPVDYRLDMRDDYRPAMPVAIGTDASDEEKDAYATEMAAWVEASKQDNLVHDGSKKRTRYHHGVIAQEIQSIIAESGVDFGGFQNHKLTGGNDVLSIGYDEFIAPLIKAVQQLSAKNDAMETRLAALEALLPK